MFLRVFNVSLCISIVRYLKLYQWQIVELYLCFSHISGKFDFDQRGSIIYQPVLNFQESLDLQSKNFNFISGTCYRLCLCFSHILGKLDLDQRLKVAEAGATEWISNFGDQIWNLLKILIRMICRSSTFGESQISRNVAKRLKVAVAGATEWISNFGN